jgi:hypothetical protein
MTFDHRHSGAQAQPASPESIATAVSINHNDSGYGFRISAADAASPGMTNNQVSFT